MEAEVCKKLGESKSVDCITSHENAIRTKTHHTDSDRLVLIGFELKNKSSAN